jgi:large subunit ribosomal protein L24
MRRSDSSNKVHVRKGDLVFVLSGRERGKTGRVLRVFPKVGRVIVEGVNKVKRHTRARGRAQQGGILEKEAPLHSSNVALLCSNCNRPTRVGKRILDDGTKVSFCRRCGEVIR